MQFLHQYPMVRLLIPFVAGIVTAMTIQPEGMPVLNGIVPITVISLTWALFYRRNATYKTRWVFGLLVSITLSLLGFSRLNQQNSMLNFGHYTHHQGHEWIVKVIDPPREKDRSFKVLTEVVAVKSGNEYLRAEGKLLCYLSKDKSLSLPEYGYILIIHAHPEPIPYSGNPGSFNYRQYLERKGIYRQVFLRSAYWKTLSENSGFSVKGIAFRLRDHLLEILQKSGLEGKEYGVAAALILGQDEILDPEIRKEYSNAGVVHILGIGGLHVGIIYLALNFLFGFLDKMKRGRYFKIWIVLSLIWFYALITGLSPAALRASTMFSFVCLGQLGHRNTHINNSIASSALFLLLIDPYLITNIGFQFSYFAVIGIVILHEPLSGLWEPRFFLLNEAWKLMVMSLAAQLFTFPITLLYFHQFPVYFLPANLVVVPLSNIIIYCGMAVLGTSFLPQVSMLIGMGTSWFIKVLSAFAGFIDSLPYSVIRNIPLNLTETTILYLIIGALIGFFLLRKKMFLPIALVLAVMVSLSLAGRNLRQQRQEKLIVYSINKHSAIGLIHGNEAITFADSALLNSPRTMEFNVAGGLVALGIQNNTQANLDQEPTAFTGKTYPIHTVPGAVLVQWDTKRIGILDSLPAFQKPQKPLALDYLIIRDNPKLRISILLEWYHPHMIIADASNYRTRVIKWQKECQKAGIPFYDTRKSGALVVDFGE